jgi:hypothetical protein
MLDVAVQSIRRHKEQRVADAAKNAAAVDEEALTALTAIEVFRGHSPVSLILMPPNRDEQLAVARVAASAFSADVLSMSFETWTTHLRCNPITNRRWGRDEMQHVVVNHDGRAKGWVADLLLVCVVNRAGDIAEAGLPYRAEAGAVHWDEARAAKMRGRAAFTGSVPAALVKIMNEASMDVTMHRFMQATGLSNRDFGVDDDRVRDHMDCVAVKFIAQLASKMGTHVGVTLTAEPGSERQEIIDRSLQDADGLSATWLDPDRT